jgi:hypothetical protein
MICRYVGNYLVVETRAESMAKKFLKSTTSIMFGLQNAIILFRVNVSVHYTTDQTKKQYNRTRNNTTGIFLPVYILQSVRRSSANVLKVTINGIQEIHPVIYLLFKFNHN